MISLKNVSKEFTIYKKDPGLKGSIKGLFKRDKEIIRAVNNISFDINKGDIIGYIGANGAGKSTTIKMMTGVLTPTSGSISINGITPHKNRIENAKNIGVVFGQRTQLWWDLPLCETYSILKEIYNVSDEDYKERLAYLSDLLGINEFIKQPVRTLSLGQRMRADIAASMLHNPSILYLDEPTIGLDVLVKEKIREIIKELNKKYKVTVILTTHDMSDIQELANKIMIIEKGNIIYNDSIDGIAKKFGNNRSLELKIDKLDDNHLNKMNSILGDRSYAKIEKEILKVNFDQDKISVAEIISYSMNNFNVLDFSLKDQSIEDIVKKLYAGGDFGEKII